MIPVKLSVLLTGGIVVLIGSSAAHAQGPAPLPDIPFEQNVEIMVQKGPGIGAVNIDFMAPPIAFSVETVIGAPYSAEAVTDFVQMLADGNRIVRQSKAEISRDSMGRTRREEGISMIGPVVNAPEKFRRVQITDPTTHTMILLDMENRLAEKLPAPRVRLMNKIEKGRGGKNVEMIYRSSVAKAMAPPNDEKLGTQVIEGVQVEGTRSTTTISAGEIGNELPITIVSERWYSPELKVLVMSRQSDPRFGDTTYRLTNITRVEPPPHLFEIPPDFTIAEPDARRDVIIERKLKN